MDADDIRQAGFNEAVAEVGVGAISRVGQGDLRVKHSGERGSKLVRRDLWLGLEDDLVRHARLSAPVWKSPSPGINAVIAAPAKASNAIDRSRCAASSDSHRIRQGGSRRRFQR